MPVTVTLIRRLPSCQLPRDLGSWADSFAQLERTYRKPFLPMKATPTTMTVAEILELRRDGLLAVDPEYQRGAVWTRPQKQYFVDSVLRGYHIPLIYLHHIEARTTAGGFQIGDRLAIIDGQQRLNALYEFAEGAFPLLDPEQDEGRFPKSLSNSPCPWAARDIHDLDNETCDRFFATPLSVATIETDDEDEVRDLFIRLQGGKPLTPQEQRDAWPGLFGTFVLRIGGKTGIARYPGHRFFEQLVRTKVGTPRSRQLVAQMVMLFDKNRDTGGFCDIKRTAVDSYYLRNIDFDAESALTKDFVQTLEIVTDLLNDGKRPTLVGHQAIHLVLLVRALRDEKYVRSSWEGKLAVAFDHFTQRVNRARSAGDESSEYLLRYGNKTSTRSDLETTIRDRHVFFGVKMLQQVRPRLRDKKRAFGPLERELIYNRALKRCQNPECGGAVQWSDAEFHHVRPHSEGGQTEVSNGALVHSDCHPKSVDAVRRFAEHFSASG